MIFRADVDDDAAVPAYYLFDLLRMLFSTSRLMHDARTVADDRRLAKASARRQRLLRDQIAAFPLSTVADASDGPAALQGQARALQLTEAPLSLQPVVGYRLRMEADFDEEDRRETRQLLDLTSLAEFELVESETQRVAPVKPERFMPLLAPEPTVHLELATLIRPPLAALVDRALVPSSELVTAKDIRATEYLLAPGELVFAFGIARREVDPTGTPEGYRATAWRTTLSSPPDGLLIIADRCRDVLLTSLGQADELVEPE